MGNQNNYYVPMSDRAFNEIKREAISLWGNYDDTYGYATEKINQIKDLKNIEDNGMFILAMFDYMNMIIMLERLSKATVKELKNDRLPSEYLI